MYKRYEYVNSLGHCLQYEGYCYIFKYDHGRWERKTYINGQMIEILIYS
jgi:hypothetical protein